MKAKVGPDEKVNVSANTKIIGETWNTMTALKKQKYEKMSIKDAERYKDQLDQIRKNGFFTTAEGVKSTDLPVKAKKVKRQKKPTSTTEE